VFLTAERAGTVFWKKAGAYGVTWCRVAPAWWNGATTGVCCAANIQKRSSRYKLSGVNMAINVVKTVSIVSSVSFVSMVVNQTNQTNSFFSWKGAVVDRTGPLCYPENKT